MKLKSLLVFIVAAFVFASCQKEESVSVEPQIEEAEVVEMPSGRLISATKTSELPATELASRMADSLHIKNTELFKFTLLEEDLFDFDIVTYRIKYRSKTLVKGHPEDIILTGDVSFVADSTGHIKNRHLESVTLFNTIFNTSQYDVTTCEDYYYTNLRSIYNALVVYPLYQGGPGSELGDSLIYATPTEFILKGRQAIDCELAALEFVDKYLDNVEMMPFYYTENVGVSNGGGTALAVQYLLENDPVYRCYANQINLRSTYIGAGHCSNKALIQNLLSVEKESAMYSSVSAGYLACVAGAYLTWADGLNHFRPYVDGTELKLTDYFSEEFNNFSFSKTWAGWWMRYSMYYGSHIIPDYTTHPEKWSMKPLNLFINNAISIYNYSYAMPSIKETVNPSLIDASDTTQFNLLEHAVAELCGAFAENEKMLSGWNPRTPLKFVHSDSDDFVPYESNYQIWKDLSHNGHNLLVKIDTQEGLSHGEGTTQCLVDIILNKHPYHAVSILSYEDLIGLVGSF